VINLVTGLPVWECILFMGCFTTLYTALGGIKAVIWTDAGDLDVLHAHLGLDVAVMKVLVIRART
jgi:Na+/proline symporter